MDLTVIYDNRTLDPALLSAWGFACLVGDTLLFDTGGDGHRLLGNMEQLHIDPSSIKTVVLSHAHADHTGGLLALLNTGARPTIYVPQAFPSQFKSRVRSMTQLVEIDGPQEIEPGIRSTGEMGVAPVEHALIVETAQGLVVITGCAHPGVENLVRRAKEITSRDIALVMGGFHLSMTRLQKVDTIIAQFQEMGVNQVAPCHCTGDRAINRFAEVYGDQFIKVGAGLKVSMEA